MKKEVKVFVNFEPNEMVFLKTDPEQNQRQVLCIQFGLGKVMYGLSLGDSFSWHYAEEISRTKKL